MTETPSTAAVTAMTPPHLRVARPVRDLRRALAMYRDGLGLSLLGHFEDHAGFDGVMLGWPGAAYHLELTVCRAHPVPPSPGPEDLLVFYFPDQAAWSAACERLSRAGFTRVPSLNPYWDQRGRTYQDADGYRTVLENAAWPGAAADA
ncbi:MAG TPA: VOC family protein [Nevskia sp.]|nr:VOC family protein [Nevskia sp.]